MAEERRPDVRDRLEAAAFRGLLAGLRSLGRERAYRAGEALGSFVANVVPLRRDVALENLRHAFPDLDEAERRRIHRDLCRNLGRVLADFARLPGLEAETLRGEVEVENVEHLRAMGERPGGALLLTGHFGNWEMLGAVVPLYGGEVTMMGATQRNPLVERMFNDARRRPGVEALSRGAGLKGVVRALRGGRLVASLADQDGGRGGFFLPFLGREASVQPGLFRLAARLGVPVLTAVSVWTGNGWKGIFDPPLETRPPGTPEEVEAEARRLAEAYTRRLEARIREHPDHWFWVHRRWKTRPPGEAQRPPAPGR